MTPYDKLHSQIADYVELVLPDDKLLQDLQNLKELYHKATAPKKRAPAKPKAVEALLRLTITEAGKTTTVTMGETQAEKYLVLKKKEHTKRVDLFVKDKGLLHPTSQYAWYGAKKKDEYKELCVDFAREVQQAGLTFEVQITRC